jgi:hypothetical protein
MASFNGATFGERGTGSEFPIWDAKEILVVKERPNEAPVLQSQGEDVQRLALVVKATGVQLSALYDQVLESGSLVYGWETHNAFLESISDVSEQLAGHDVYFATLNLIRL